MAQDFSSIIEYWNDWRLVGANRLDEKPDFGVCREGSAQQNQNQNQSELSPEIRGEGHGNMERAMRVNVKLLMTWATEGMEVSIIGWR